MQSFKKPQLTKPNLCPKSPSPEILRLGIPKKTYKTPQNLKLNFPRMLRGLGWLPPQPRSLPHPRLERINRGFKTPAVDGIVCTLCKYPNAV